MGWTHRVVIVGGGFGGLRAAQALKKAPVDVTLVDRRNVHLFQPLLYQVATGSLSPGEIASRQRVERPIIGRGRPSPPFEPPSDSSRCDDASGAAVWRMRCSVRGQKPHCQKKGRYEKV